MRHFRLFLSAMGSLPVLMLSMTTSIEDSKKQERCATVARSCLKKLSLPTDAAEP